MANFIAFILLAVFCVIVACCYVTYTTRKIKSKMKREVAYSEIMVKAAALEYECHEQELRSSFNCYPAIRKYLCQSKYMLNNGIPFFETPNLTKLSRKDKTLRCLLSELDEAPVEIKKLVFKQAEIIGGIVEAKNPILSKMDNFKKNTQLRILLYFLKLAVKIKKN